MTKSGLVSQFHHIMTFPDLRRATKSGLVNSFRLLWVVIVLWCERGVFLWSLLGCRWPDLGLRVSRHTIMNFWLNCWLVGQSGFRHPYSPSCRPSNTGWSFIPWKTSMAHEPNTIHSGFQHAQELERRHCQS